MKTLRKILLLAMFLGSMIILYGCEVEHEHDYGRHHERERTEIHMEH